MRTQKAGLSFRWLCFAVVHPATQRNMADENLSFNVANSVILISCCFATDCLNMEDMIKYSYPPLTTLWINF